MEILSESFKINFEEEFEEEITLEWIEELFEKRKIKPFRWAITEIDSAKGILRIDYTAMNIKK